MACFGENEYDPKDINGKCPDCGEPTIDGLAADGCYYSPIECDTCKHRPCDQSC